MYRHHRSIIVTAALLALCVATSAVATITPPTPAGSAITSTAMTGGPRPLLGMFMRGHLVRLDVQLRPLLERAMTHSRIGYVMESLPGVRPYLTTQPSIRKIPPAVVADQHLGVILRLMLTKKMGLLAELPGLTPGYLQRMHRALRTGLEKAFRRNSLPVEMRREINTFLRSIDEPPIAVETARQQADDEAMGIANMLVDSLSAMLQSRQQMGYTLADLHQMIASGGTFLVVDGEVLDDRTGVTDAWPMVVAMHADVSVDQAVAMLGSEAGVAELEARIGSNTEAPTAPDASSLAERTPPTAEEWLGIFLNGLLRQAVVGNPAGAVSSSFAAAPLLMVEVGVPVQVVDNFEAGFSAVLDGLESDHRILRHTVEAIERFAGDADQLRVIMLPPTAELAKGTAAFINIRGAEYLSESQLAADPTQPTPQTELPEAHPLEEAVPRDVIIVSHSEEFGRNPILWLTQVFHEATHFADSRLLSAWAHANQRLIASGRPADALFSSFARTVDGQAVLQDGFLIAFFESRAGLAEHQMIEILARPRPNITPKDRARKLDLDRQRTVKYIESHGDDAVAVVRSLGITGNNVFERAMQLGDQMQVTINAAAALPDSKKR